MDTWILKMVRATCIRRLMAWTAALAFIALLGLGQLRLIENFIWGPYDLGPTDLEGIRDVTETRKYFARVTGSRVINIGIQQSKSRKRTSVEADRSKSEAYYVLVVGERLLICKSSSGFQKVVEGELAPIPADLERQIFSSVEMQALRPRFYPFYLRDESVRVGGYVAIAGMLMFGFLFMKQCLPAWKYLQNPNLNPVVKRVAAWGDPIIISLAVEGEKNTPRFKRGGWAITDQFLVQSTFFRFDLLRWRDLLWAYKTMTSQSVNFIPAGKSYGVELICYDGAATVQGDEKIVDEILHFAAQRSPWAVFGFSKEIEEFFNNRPRDFCAAVETRRRDCAQAPFHNTRGTLFDDALSR